MIPNLGKVAFILTGGGFTGAYSVGFLYALLKRGIKPDFIQGVSVGAITAVKIIESALNVKPLIKRWLMAERLGREKIFDFYEWFSWKNIWRHPVEVLNRLRNSTSLSTNTQIFDLLIRGINFQAVVNAGKSGLECQVIAFNETTANREIFSNLDDKIIANPDLLGQAVLASISLPIFLPTVFIDGQPYCDGKIIKISEAIRKKCNTIFILNNGNFLPDGKNYHEMKWWRRGIFDNQLSGVELARSKIEFAMDHGYKLIQNNPSPALDNIRPIHKPGIGQRIKKIGDKLADAVDNPEEISDIFTPLRLVVLTPPNPISSLSTIDFKKGDITAAIQQCSEINDNVWEQFY